MEAMSMAMLGVLLFFRTPDLWVTNEALGQRLQTTPDDTSKTEIRLPTTPTCWKEEMAELPVAGQPYIEGDPEPPTRSHDVALVGRHDDYSIVKILRGTYNIEAPFGVEEYRVATEDEGLGRQCTAIVANAIVEVQRAIALLIDWARSYSRQTTLPPPPEGIYPICLGRLVDIAAGVEFGPLTGRVQGTLRIVDGRTALTEADFSHFAQHLETGPPGFPELMLADAEHLVMRISSSGERERAVVAAAIACESKTKHVAKSLASQDQVALVEWILKQYRSVPQSPPELMSNLLDVVAGRSLNKENKTTFRGVNDLFERRNEIVHREGSVTHDEAKELVGHARSALHWLRDVQHETTRHEPAEAVYLPQSLNP